MNGKSKMFFLIWSLGLLFAAGAWAQQLEVKMTLAYNVFVVGEPVLVQFELLNATREMIDVGGPDSKDVLLVEITQGGQYNDVKPFRSAPLAPPFQLKPGQSFQHKAELDKWFALIQEGKYIVRLVLAHDGMRYESAKKSFDVVPGIPISGGIQMFVRRQNLKRQFNLVYWHRNQTDRLFLRSADEPGSRIWDSIDLGTLMRGTPPKLDISPEGVVTIIHRSTQDAFLRTVLWSLPDSLEVVERNSLVDPEISASQRVKALYGEVSEEDNDTTGKKSWWKFW